MEVAVLETGLGGRLDPVSRYKMDETVITTIGMDHMDLLGDTIEQIAMGKNIATIGYQGYVISMPQEQSVRRIIEVTSEMQNARLIFVEPKDLRRYPDGKFDYQEFTGLETKLLGENATPQRGDGCGPQRGRFRMWEFLSLRRPCARALPIHPCWRGSSI